ncbi:MAG: hypothetical protein KDB27_02075 [Planctomycetales bacterium]|nr:hypothetical protein [Planctomycetales bacterium]
MRSAPSLLSIIGVTVANDSIVCSATRQRSDGRGRFFYGALLVSILSALSSATANAASFLTTEQLYYSGQYNECLEIAVAEFDRGVWNDRWPQLAMQCLMTTGRYSEAKSVYDRATKRFATSIGIRAFGADVLRFNGDDVAAVREPLEMITMVNTAPWRYSSSADLITLGRFFIGQGEDAKKVLELFYDRVKKSNSSFAPVYIASAELAISKNDFQLAATELETAAKLQPANPDVFQLQAVAFSESDSEKAAEFLSKALQLNPRHIPSLLMKAEFEIDAERYGDADETLSQVLAINPWHPQAWAYHAVIAHLAGHFDGERAIREIALANWKTNHHVDHWIGQKLSQKYRFREGAQYQRQSLMLASSYVPARFQLAQDLLRLGDEEAGWQMAQQVYDNDAYNVVAYNLLALNDELQKFTTLQNDRFIVRMDSREARIYGQRVLRLLDEAHSTLCSKYGVTLDGPVTVEIFPRQKDFAIRTFGLPGGAGFLGVCFGRVITANSPASQGNSPSNWQAVLWHEFCHVVTLEKTLNRMPRWLSEGISVYEERQRDDAWGERLTPEYQTMLLGDDLTPVSQLSGAFLRPKSPTHLQFAYYQSSLVVEFLIKQHGFETLVRILDDLAVGMPINDAIERYTGSIVEFEQAFEAFAKRTANEMAPGLEFDKIEVEPGEQPTPEMLLEFGKRENNYWAIHQRADRLIQNEELDAAAELLEGLFQKFPSDRSTSSAAVKLARIYRKLDQPGKERESLAHVAGIVDDALPVYRRLMEIDAESETWPSVMEHAQRMLAVQPLQAFPHELLAKGAEHSGDTPVVVDARSALLEMEPTDPAKAHFDLATSLHTIGETDKAKRQVLMALEFAPRYQEALKLLVELQNKDDGNEQ